MARWVLVVILGGIMLPVFASEPQRSVVNDNSSNWGDQQTLTYIKNIRDLLISKAKENDSEIRKLNAVWQGVTFRSFENFYCNPTIDLSTVLERFYEFPRYSLEVFILAYIYLDKLTANPSLSHRLGLNSNTVHKLVIASLVVANMFHDDLLLPESYLADVGGIKTSELSAIVNNFLFKIDFALYVSEQEYMQYRDWLLDPNKAKAPMRESKARAS